jgi:hypothetical protein
MPESQSKSRSGRDRPDRRRIVLTGAAVLGVAALPGVAAAADDDGLGPATDLLAGTRHFLSSLELDKRKAASLPGTGRNGPDGITSAPPGGG